VTDRRSRKPPSIDQRRRTIGEPQRKEMLLRTLNEFALKLLEMPTRSELLWYVAREVVARLGFDDCVVYLVDPDRSLLRQVAAIGAKNPDREEIANVLEIPIGKGITGRVAETRQPLIVGDLRGDDRYIPDLDPALSEICVPLVVDGTLVGVIDCEDPRLAHFGEEHLEVLTTIAAMTSAKLKLIEELVRAERRGEDLRRLNATLRTEIAERERAEAALQESAAQLQSILDHAPAAIYLKDAEGRYVLANRSFEELFGVASQEIRGRLPVEVVPGDLARASSRYDRQVLLSGQPVVAEQEFLVDSERHVALVTRFPIRDAAGTITGIGAVAWDISERKRAEEQLRSSEARLSQASRLAKVGYYVWDAVQDRCLFCSEQHARIHGLTPEAYSERAAELNGTYTLTHPDDREAFREAMKRLRGGEAIEIEYRTLTPDGGSCHVREICEPVLDATGRVVQEIGASQDITELRRIETLLVRAMDVSPAVFALFDPDDRLVICNREYRRMYDTEAMPIVPGVAFADLVRSIADSVGIGDSREETDAWVARRLRRRSEPARSDEYRQGNGDWIEVSDFLLEDGSVFTVGKVITEKKLIEAQLQQAQKMEAIGQLTGGVAHDFNNLLAVILGNAELLAARGPGDLQRLIGPILHAAQRGAELTQRLLAFSRRQPLRPRAVDLRGLLAQVSALVEPVLGETITVETVTPAGLWPALADPAQLENALLNLAINARDAMPGGGRLVIECENGRLDESYAARNPEASTGDRVVLSVTDSGTGMSAEIREHAFEPFFTTKEVGQGSGLGLSMVYGFARQSGGHAVLYSEEGHGTTVRLYLPRAAAAPLGEAVDGGEALPMGRGETVLVIEDDAAVRRLVVRMLRRLDYRPIEAADAAGARAALGREPIALLLSDVVLPGGTSGPAFAEEARDRIPGLETLFMSGYPSEAARRGDLLGSDSLLLTKPFRIRQLARALREVLDRGSP